MALRLGHRLLQELREVLGTQRELAVVHDEVVQGVKGHGVDQVELGLTSLLPRLDPTVIHLPLSPENNGVNRPRTFFSKIVKMYAFENSFIPYYCIVFDTVSGTCSSSR